MRLSRLRSAGKNQFWSVSTFAPVGAKWRNRPNSSDPNFLARRLRHVQTHCAASQCVGLITDAPRRWHVPLKLKPAYLAERSGTCKTYQQIATSCVGKSTTT